MDPVQVPVVSAPANNFGLLLVGIGLLCLGLGVGWWWTRTTHSEGNEDQTDGSDRNNENEAERSSDETGDTGAFVFGTEENDSEAFDLVNEKNADNDAVDNQE